jgi:hypothetical protein
MLSNFNKITIRYNILNMLKLYQTITKAQSNKYVDLKRAALLQFGLFLNLGRIIYFHVP